MRPWSRKREQVNQLVQSFFINDPYYPRPRPQDPLYHKFCLGYTDACPKGSEEAVEIAATFFRAIEVEQARRDSVSTMT